MTTATLQILEGRRVCVALRDGTRIDDCQLVSAGRTTTTTLWLFSNGSDVFIPYGDVTDVWETIAAVRAA